MRWMTERIDALVQPSNRRGFVIGLVLALCYAILPPVEAMVQAFSQPFTIQEDARQFLFWMQQWRNPALFVGDPIAEYFQAVTPFGFKAMHWLLDMVGLEPFTANKLLPLPLFLATAYFSYRIAWLIYPVAAIGVAASWLTCFFLSLIDQSLLSAVPRAFAVPLFLWFLFACMRGRVLAVAAACLSQGLFYPLVALVSAGVLGLSLLRWKNDKPRLALDRKSLAPVGAGLIAIVAVLLPYLLNTGGYGPVISATEAAQTPAFQNAGRSAFFLGSGIETYLCGARAGLLPVEWGCGEAFRQGLFFAPILAILLIVFAIASPIGLAIKATNPASGYSAQGAIFLAVIGAGMFWFVAAHVMLFELHLPSRYLQHPLRATAWIAGTLLFGVMLLATGRRFCAKYPRRIPIIRGFTLMLAGGFFILPLPLGPSPYANYITGKHPTLYAFLRSTPLNATVASLALEADNIPSFTGRAVHSAREYAIPYASGYMKPLAKKSRALIHAQYAIRRGPLADYIKRYRPSYLLLDRTAFDARAIAKKWWRADYPDKAVWAQRQLQGGRPYLLQVLANCRLVESAPLVLVDAECLLGK